MNTTTIKNRLEQSFNDVQRLKEVKINQSKIKHARVISIIPIENYSFRIITFTYDKFNTLKDQEIAKFQRVIVSENTGQIFAF